LHRNSSGPAALAVALAALARIAVALAVPGAAAAAEPPSIVLVSIDTLRSDRLPAYGYRGVETPAIDALARDGVLFEHAYSQVPLTLPSHLSMLSGVPPAEHGVRDNLGYRFDASRHPWAPELLARAGYSTAAFVSAFVLRAETGFAAGFRKFDAELEPGTASDIGNVQRPGRETVARAKQWLAANAASRFFLMVHLYEPHTPWEPDPAFRTKYPDPYDGEVATADALVGDLMAELRRLGLYDRSLVLLVSDHGEGLGDHGEKEHGLLLYREAIQVPMILKLPRQQLAGQRVAAAAQLLDVAPTLLAAADAKVPAAMQGVPLGELARSSAAPRRILSETVLPRLHYGWSDLISVVEFPFQLIQGPDPELYDLARDPGSTKNLRASERRVFHDLRAEAEAHVVPLAEPGAEDAETAAKLAALGYLGGRARTAGALADPKSKLPLLEEFQRARATLDSGNAAAALPVFRKVVADTPGMTEGWINLGHALRQPGHQEDALAAYKKALEISTGATSAAFGAAVTLSDLGRYDEARRHAELALPVAPVQTQELLAIIALTQRDNVAAEKAARAAIAGGSGQIQPLVLLARALNNQDRPNDALAELVKAEQRLALLAPGSRDYEGLFLARGDSYMKLGQPRDAFTAYEREVLDFPDKPLGYVSLAILFATVGRPREASRFLHELVQKNPEQPAAYRAAALTLQKLGAVAEGKRVLAEGRRRFPEDAALRAIEAGKSIPIALEAMP
jgi:arylsulfatase A-like enzyme